MIKKSQVQHAVECCQDNKGKVLAITAVLIIGFLTGGEALENATFCYVVKMFVQIDCKDLVLEEAKQDGKQNQQ
ncbi:MAG: hypothetical protein MN733_25765 [Nitrososphaera sp.]|nr:hypothetical protein [Nitrososphaera sp.]